MAEYIEREAAEQNESICRSCFHSYVCEQFNEHRDGDNKKCHFYNDHFVPVADVVEVRHGEWVDNGFINDKPAVRCTECDIVFCDQINNHRVMFNYCPYCGAKMDGKGDN